MRRKLSRVVVGFLTIGMIFSGNVQGIVWASDREEIAMENEQMQLEEDISDSEEVVEENHGQQKENTENIEGDVSNQEEVLENQEEVDLPEQSDEVPVETEEEPQKTLDINYFYLEKLSVYEDEALNVVLSLGEGTEQIDNVSLTYADEAGNQYEWQSADNSSELFLFEKTFEEEASGIYQFITVNFRTSGEEKSISFQEKDMSIFFGVNCEYDGSSSTESLEMESLSTETEMTATVTTIDEDGVANDTAELEVAEALTELGVAAQTRRSLLRSARSNGNIVVVLDPGHDASHSGARANGVQEEVATLKIAQYCKEELEKYSGITVYMTRTTAACPFPSTIGKSGGNIIDIKERVKWAASKGANAFVSFHLDSAGASAHGAHVYYPGTWFASNDIVNQGAGLANAIQKELIGVGLYNRGTESADYAVNTESASYGFPGLIIEHAFLTNVSDANTYLKTPAGLKRLGVADANGIVKYFGLTKGYWHEVNGKRYYYQNGVKVIGSYAIGNNFYYFDPQQNGAAYTGWRKDGNDTYYYSEQGVLTLGTRKIDGDFYYFSQSTGKMQTGFAIINSDTYYYDSQGKMKFGEQSIDGKLYYFNTMNGKQKVGFVQNEKGSMYYTKDGEILKGTQKIGNAFYYFDENSGIMQTGFQTIGNAKYYYNADGKLTLGTQKIDGDFYYFNNMSGKMQKGFQTIEGAQYYYNTDGKMLFGTRKIEGDFYYFSPMSGKMQKGFQTISDAKYYYNAGGKMLFGTQKIEGGFYYFSPMSGKMQKGFQVIGDAEYYYNADGKMLFGTQKIEDDFYYFSPTTGKMQMGFQIIGSSKYYYDTDGKMLFGTQKIEDIYYFFNVKTGIMENKLEYLYKIEGETETTVAKMVQYYQMYSPIAYPGAELGKGGATTLEAFALIYFEESQKENIRAEVAWTQAMLETGWLKFGGDVQIGQFNFAGLGAVGQGAGGLDFSIYGTEGVRMGVRAQIQHLKAYANKEPLKNTCIDPRFGLVKRGSATYVEWLGIQENPSGTGWAAGVDYGFNIRRMISKLQAI